MHPVVYNRLSVPVGGVYYAFCAVSIPCIIYCSFIEFTRKGEIGLLSTPLCDESRPLYSVTGSCSVWLKGIIRFFFVFFKVWFP